MEKTHENVCKKHVLMFSCVAQKINRKKGGDLTSELPYKANDSGECSQG